MCWCLLGIEIKKWRKGVYNSWEDKKFFVRIFLIWFLLAVIRLLVSEHHSNLLQTWLWRNVHLPQLQRTPWIPPAKEIKALSLFELHSHTICHGASAAAASRNDKPISPDKTYTGRGWAARRGSGRHHLRCMTESKTDDSPAQEYPA